jgi:hypothetical protein
LLFFREFVGGLRFFLYLMVLCRRRGDRGWSSLGQGHRFSNVLFCLFGVLVVEIEYSKHCIRVLHNFVLRDTRRLKQNFPFVR